MADFISVLVSGVAFGVPLFLVASGLSLIYGVVGVLNFAHGSLFVVGALLATTIVGNTLPSGPLFILAIVASAAVVGALGLLIEGTVIRRLYSANHITMLLATFAILLILEGASGSIWGSASRTIQKPAALAGNVTIAGSTIPVYNLLLVAVGAVIAVGLFFLINKTTFGRAVRAVTQDATMSEAIGLNARQVMLLVFGLGSALAGVAGVLMAPTLAVTPSLGQAFILQSFAVVIIGGLGSITGSLVAALLVGVAEAASVTYFPVLSGFTFYILVLVVLLVRPRGLLAPRLGRS